MKKYVAALLALMFAFIACAAQEDAAKRSAVGFYFDTVVSITAYTDDAQLLDRALEQCQKYEQLLSKTIEGSDVWNINHAQGQPVAVAQETLEVLEIAQYVSGLSQGAFDVTIAPAVSLWDFAAENPVLPDGEALAQAAALADYTKLVIEDGMVTLPADMQIDLGGVAKGYIADQIAQFLRDNGVTSALLNFGGNVVTIGEKPDGQGPWRVGIQNPDQSRGAYLLAVTATDMAVVTSGIYERGFDLDGVRYHHLLDPETGWPVQNELSSVTIFAERSGLADALSTATFVLGTEAGMAMIEALDGVEALFVTRDEQILATSGAAALVVSNG